ncbi:MAG TPA: dephospho-CoA kinase [Chloroflexota bacterium]|nr:dephospho-CoA kinase [Chloroflexota bacterium]
MFVIGLTGNIGCGKSTVARMLAEHGARVVDADRVYHDLIAGPGELPDLIVAAFGESVRATNGSIDRGELGKIVFADPAALRLLEEITHPYVARRVWSILSTEQPRLAVIEAIKLLEASWRDRCDQIWVVTCDPQQQIDRLAQSRGLSAEDVAVRVRAQSSQAEKARQADVVIDNSGDLTTTQNQVERALAVALRGVPHQAGGDP